MRAAIQRDLSREEEWAVRNFVKFKKDKCQALHLRETNTLERYRVGSPCLGRTSEEKDLGVFVGSKLNMSQQHSLADMEATASWPA